MSHRPFPHPPAAPVCSPADKRGHALLPLGAFMLAGLSTLGQQALAQTATPGATRELATVQVQADADKPDGLRASTTRVGKMLQDPHDVPQAITTVTSALMEQQQVGSLKEALRNVSGLSFNAAEGGRSGDNMNLRGFYTFGDMYLDGIRDTAQYNRETFNLEQVDVLRGAGAMLFGRGQAGGVINQVSKMPKSYEQNKISASVGTDGYTELSADINKPINENTSIRVNAMKRDEGSWRSNPSTGTQPEVHRQGVALSLGLNQNTDNQFWLNYLELQTHDNPDYGVSFNSSTRAPGTALPASTFFGNDNTFDKSDTQITTLINEYKLSSTSQLRTQVRMADYDRSYWAKTPNLATPPDPAGAVGGNVTRTSRYKTLTLQSDYSTQFKAWGMNHEAIAGVEYLNEDSRRLSLQNFGTVAVPDFRPYQESTSGQGLNSFKSDSYAVYAQNTVEFFPLWKATAGVRRDLMDAKYSGTASPALKFGENSYRSALSFHPSDDTHYYLAWSSSFSPTADLYQLTVRPQPAERSDVLELGAKWLLLDGDLSMRAALYQANKDWERSADLESTAAILTKKRRTNGLEFEVAGRITEQWEVFAGLSLMDAKILEVAENYNASGVLVQAPSAYAGQTARNTPAYTVNLWTTYKVAPQWTVAGGLEAKGERQGFNPSSTGAVPTLNGAYQPNTAPAYVRWDAMVAYEINQWKLQFNIKNLFDQRYYDSIYDNGGFTVAGTRRSATLTGEYRF